jgi:hypothetical protein
LAINGTKAGEINSNGVRSLGEVLIVEDEKPTNTAGGTFTSGAWRTRDLNSVRVNRITGASLASIQITLPAGTYRIFAKAPGYVVSFHKIRLYNVTDSVAILIGSNENSGGVITVSMINAEFTLASTKSLTIEHRCATTRASDGFGGATNFSEPEIYTQVLVQRIA